MAGAAPIRVRKNAAASCESAAPRRWSRVWTDGSSAPLALPSGPRHSEARGLIAIEPGRVALAGMLDGPGTHSADADASLLSARGFLVELPLP